MEELEKIIDLISKNYNIRFVVEQLTYNKGIISYRLKRRKYVRFVPFMEKKKYDEYELNELNNKIKFDSIEKIKEYLKVMFSEPEGFVTDFTDISV